jgi:BRCT domain type II-containing protein
MIKKESELKQTGITPSMEKFNLQEKPVLAPKSPIVNFSTKSNKNEKSVESKISSIGESDLLEAVNEVPKDLLNGLTFVLSGVFQEMGRERLESFICEHGGRCTSAISGKTNYLVIGYKLEDGREVV